MYRIVASSLLLLLSFISCRNNNDSSNDLIEYVDDFDYPFYNLKLSEIANIEFVQLKDPDKALILNPYMPLNTYIGEDCILIGDMSLSSPESSRILMFDKNGNYIRTIAGYGRGPGEIYGMYRMMVQKESEKIYVFSIDGMSLSTFDFNGNCIKHDKITNRRFFISAVYGDKILLHENQSQYKTNTRYVDHGKSLVAIDSETYDYFDIENPTYQRLFDINCMQSLYPDFIYSPNGIYLQTLRTDTVYLIREDLKIIPRCVNKCSMEKGYDAILPVIETEDYVLFARNNTVTAQIRDYSHYIFLKEESKLYRLPCSNISGAYIHEKLLQNEIAFSSINVSLNPNVLVVYWTYEVLNKYYDRLSEDLRKMADNITEDDNPILMILTFEK